jgi:hypothetical protein
MTGRNVLLVTMRLDFAKVDLPLKEVRATGSGCSQTVAVVTRFDSSARPV